MDSSRLGAGALLLLLGLEGCAAYAHALGVESPTLRAPNPLRGEPLHVGGGASADASKCDRPFDAAGFSLSASSQEICMTEVVLTESRPEGPPPAEVSSIERVLAGDAPKSVIELASQGPSTNVSRCPRADGLGEKIVWSQSFKGCTANKGILLPTTKAFGLLRDDGRVDHERTFGGTAEQTRALRWEFEAGGATTPTATPSETRTTAADPPAGSAASPTSPVAAKYKTDVGKCMRGEPVDAGSMVGGGTCKLLQRAAQTGDTSQLPKGAEKVFLQIRGGGGG
jgi:hypothetical protein